MTRVSPLRPPAWEEWYDLVRALASHAVDRYGLAEVATWNFEVWNELWGMSFPNSCEELGFHAGPTPEGQRPGFPRSICPPPPPPPPSLHRIRTEPLCRYLQRK